MQRFTIFVRNGSSGCCWNPRFKKLTIELETDLGFWDLFMRHFELLSCLHDVFFILIHTKSIEIYIFWTIRKNMIILLGEVNDQNIYTIPRFLFAISYSRPVLRSPRGHFSRPRPCKQWCTERQSLHGRGAWMVLFKWFYTVCIP